MCEPDEIFLIGGSEKEKKRLEEQKIFLNKLGRTLPREILSEYKALTKRLG